MAVPHDSSPGRPLLTADASSARSAPAAPIPDRATSLRDRLRRDTRTEHEALDARFEGMFAEPGLPRYGGFLAMNLAAHRAIEPILAASPLAGAGWSPTGRLEALERDAGTLGLDTAHEGIPAFPIPAPTLPQAFGIAYVLEGSRLGARFMAKALRADPAGPRNAMPMAYLDMSSDPAPFRGLLAAMAASGPGGDEEALSVIAADETFRFFREIADRLETRAAALQGTASR